MVTIFTDENTKIQITGVHGQLSNQQPEHLMVHFIRDYLAIYQPNRYIPNWEEMHTGDVVTCLTIGANSDYYMNENFLSDEELKVLIDRLECITDWTDPEPDNPEEFLKDFRAQANQEIPEWKDLPYVIRRRFTDCYHHSVERRETSRLSWLDVEMMLVFAQRYGYCFRRLQSLNRPHQNCVEMEANPA